MTKSSKKVVGNLKTFNDLRICVIEFKMNTFEQSFSVMTFKNSTHLNSNQLELLALKKVCQKETDSSEDDIYSFLHNISCLAQSSLVTQFASSTVTYKLSN